MSQRKQEIENKIQATTAAQRRDSKLIDELRQERAKLSIEGDNKNSKRITCIDNEIIKLTTAIGNYPAELELLQQNLATENQRIAQNERDTLLEKQNEVAENIENLSQQFIEALKTANEINNQLQAALQAYSGLQQKTGETVLSNEHCQGSQDYLRVLLETMEYQMAGTHTAMAGGRLVLVLNYVSESVS